MFGICGQNGSSTSTTSLAHPSPSDGHSTAGIRKVAVADVAWLVGPIAVALQATSIPRGAGTVAVVVVRRAGTVTLTTTVPLPRVRISKRYCACPWSNPWALRTVNAGLSVVTWASPIGLRGSGSAPSGGPGDVGGVGPPPES